MKKPIFCDGRHDARYKDGWVELGMTPVQQIEAAGDDFFVNTGSPHHVRFVENVNDYPVVNTGAEIRYGQTYQPNGTNVNFVSKNGDKGIFVRTYERGVENETLSCGTGVTACALVFGLQNQLDLVNIKTPGGNLAVKFKANENGSFQDIMLMGPAEQVFKGTISF